jgi:hypothetical protein
MCRLPELLSDPYLRPGQRHWSVIRTVSRFSFLYGSLPPANHGKSFPDNLPQQLTPAPARIAYSRPVGEMLVAWRRTAELRRAPEWSITLACVSRLIAGWHTLPFFAVDISSEKTEKRYMAEVDDFAASHRRDRSEAETPPVCPFVLDGEGAAGGTIQACALKAGNIMKESNAWTVADTESASVMQSTDTAPDQRLRRAEAEVHRLTQRMALKDRQLCELRKALAHSATVHYSFEDRLQRELDSLRGHDPSRRVRDEF